jgi:hypothetical protein
LFFVTVAVANAVKETTQTSLNGGRIITLVQP